MPRENIRNVAIIAHVDHGKTTVVDQLLRQSGQFRQGELAGECILDSNPLEWERGITILSKNCAIDYTDREGQQFHINIVDTPGHADFSGEVERVLKMADGVLLLVDAFEGPMLQTRFVLQKALQLGLKPLVVINKVDRKNARPLEVLDEVFDLFVELEASDAQLDFPCLYAAGREGWAARDLADPRTHLVPLLEAIVEHVPEPAVVPGPLQMLVTTLDVSDYVGRIGIGRVFRGSLKAREPVSLLKRDGTCHRTSVKQLFLFDGLGRREVDTVRCGDICAAVGLDQVDIGDTIADLEKAEPVHFVAVDEPTLTMNFMVNDSPFFGKEGKFVTSRHLRDRLFKETEKNLALRVEETDSEDKFIVYGRGILHLSVLIETMRREGYELQVGRPKVILKEIDGKQCEPYETLVIDVPEDLASKAINLVTLRKGDLHVMEPKGDLPGGKDPGHGNRDPGQ